MADRRSAHLSVSPVALREATGQANNFEMTPIWRRMRDDAEEEEKKKVDALAVVASSSSAPSNNAAASAAAAAPIEQRRLDAQRHRHAEVWTKDPHGGRHRPAGPSSKGLDPLTHDPKTGDLLPLPPAGFEKPLKPGPTTNFVGDAMLGAPMDMIGAKLATADARALSSVAASLVSSLSSAKPLPLAAPARRLLLLSGSEQEQNEQSDAPPVIERYDFAKAREVAAALLGRRLPTKTKTKTRQQEEQQHVEIN